MSTEWRRLSPSAASVTINEVEGAVFGVNIIPHTQAVTTLGRLTVGARVNLEVDQVARYVEQLLLGFSDLRRQQDDVL